MTVAHARELGAALRKGFQPVPLSARTKGPEEPLAPVLVLDLSSRTGWALLWDQEHLSFGVRDFSDASDGRRGRRPKSLGMRLLRFRTWLRDLLYLVRPALVVYTEPGVESAWHHRSLGRNLEGILLTELEGRVAHWSTPQREVNWHATGRPRPKSAQLIDAARERWKQVVLDPAEARALCLLAWQVDQPDGGPP